MRKKTAHDSLIKAFKEGFKTIDTKPSIKTLYLKWDGNKYIPAELPDTKQKEEENE